MVDYDVLSRAQSAFSLSTIKEVAEEVAPGVGGFVGAGIAGRQVQNKLGVGDSTVTGLMTVSALKAILANNVPKLVGWAILRGRGKTADTANLGVATNIGFDLLMRLLNNGQNPAAASVMGYQVLGEGRPGAPRGDVPADTQHLIQENADIRDELAKAYALLDQYGIVPGQLDPADVSRRQRKFGAMTAEDVARRQKRYGAMKTQKELVMAGMSDSSVPDLTRMFDMR